jgi:hypothetical protein
LVGYLKHVLHAGCAGERYLARGKYVSASRKGDMLAATRGDP